MALRPGDDFDRDILDIIPERFDADADSREAQAGHRLRSILLLGVAVVAVGGVVAAAWHFIGAGGSSAPTSGTPVIQADDHPIKVRPDDRGGMQVPNQDKLVYQRMEGEPESKTERLLPPPEQPLAPPKEGADQTAAASSAAAPAAGPGGTAPAAGPSISLPGSASSQARPGPAGEAPVPNAAPQAPVASQPLHGASGPSGYTPVDQRPTQAAPAIPPVPAPVAVPAEPSSGVAPRPEARPPEPVARPVEREPRQQVASLPRPATPPPPSAPAAARTYASGDYLVQLGALRSAEAADREWARLQRTEGQVLGPLKSDIVRVDLGEKGTFWRLRAGPLSEQAAKQLCHELSAHNQGCLVAHK